MTELPKRGDWRSFLGRRVRIYDAVNGKTLFAEGEVIGFCDVPTIMVRADDGTISHHARTLPMEVQQWERL